MSRQLEARRRWALFDTLPLPDGRVDLNLRTGYSSGPHCLELDRPPLGHQWPCYSPSHPGLPEALPSASGWCVWTASLHRMPRACPVIIVQRTTLHLSLDPTSRGLTKTNLLLPRSAEAPLTSSTARSPAGLAEMATAETGRWLPPASAGHIMTCRKEGRQWAVVEGNIVLPLSVFPTSWRIPRTRAVGESAEPLRPPETVEPHV